MEWLANALPTGPYPKPESVCSSVLARSVCANSTERSVDAFTFGTTCERTSPVSRDTSDMTVVFSVERERSGLKPCRLLGLPPIQVSSATTRPESRPAMGSSFMASLTRCMRCQAVRGVTPYLRSISRALMPFLAALASKITISHVRIGILVPWKIVSVSTERGAPASFAHGVALDEERSRAPNRGRVSEVL